jgi:hypothetical protein
MSSSNRIALFIDGANLYATAKALGFDIDYKRLLTDFQNRGTAVRAFYYTAIIEDQEYSTIRPLIDWLSYNGYTVVTKAIKEFVDASGRRKMKGNGVNLRATARTSPSHVSSAIFWASMTSPTGRAPIGMKHSPSWRRPRSSISHTFTAAPAWILYRLPLSLPTTSK